jgi:hypothetical protein
LVREPAPFDVCHEFVTRPAGDRPRCYVAATANTNGMTIKVQSRRTSKAAKKAQANSSSSFTGFGRRHDHHGKLELRVAGRLLSLIIARGALISMLSSGWESFTPTPTIQRMEFCANLIVPREPLKPGRITPPPRPT